MALQFQLERFSEARSEGKELILANCAETGRAPVDPDEQVYAEFERQGKFHLVTARSEGKLAGYLLALVTPSLHYRDIRIGAVDSYYLLPEFRKGFAALQMFRFAENSLRARGANLLAAGICSGNRKSEALMRYMRLECAEETWTKRL